MYDVQRWAKEYRDRGFAICRLRKGEKRPTYKAWNRYSLEPDDFCETDNIGLQAGSLSRNLVCVDLDHADVLQQADVYLPPTGMVEGRPGKPRSHRWFTVTNVPAELTAKPDVAGGLGGPRIKRFQRTDGTTLVEFLGTGSQAAVPASVWFSRDRARTERRHWEQFEEPAVVDCQELYDAIGRLAATAGWQPKERRKRGREKLSREAPPGLPMPTGDAARQAHAYLAKVPPGIEGQGGDAQTYFAACLLVLDFGLPPHEAMPLLLDYNRRCQPPWTAEELWHKLLKADEQERDDRGWRVRKRRGRVACNVGGDDPVYVGVACAGQAQSYIDLSPSLYAGMVKTESGWQLAPELEAVRWEGRNVVLTPTSMVVTNAREVWGEFFLARLLRGHGAAVKSIRLPHWNGRRRTLAMAGEEGWVEVDPPVHAWEAKAAAEKASQEAKRLDNYRRALPRTKGSPKLAKAIKFLQEHGAETLNKALIQRAKKRGLSKRTLQRALEVLRENTKPAPLSLLCNISVYLALLESAYPLVRSRVLANQRNGARRPTASACPGSP